jgi:hypothetical protein
MDHPVGTISRCNKHRVSLCIVQNASWANCGKPCHTDQIHLFSACQPGTICILHLKINKMIFMIIR